MADLPFHVMGRSRNPRQVGRCRDGRVEAFSSQELFDRVRDLSLGLSCCGVGKGDRVAILSETRTEWLLTDLAILTAGAVTVPIYPTLSAQQIQYILQDSGAKVVVISTALQLDKVQEVRHLLPSLEAVAVMDDVPVRHQGSVLALSEIASRGHGRLTGEWGTGREFREFTRGITPQDLATIIYTSGTSGEPKGVMLTHGNLVANMISCANVLNVGHDDVALSYLPLSHSFE